MLSWRKSCRFSAARQAHSSEMLSQPLQMHLKHHSHHKPCMGGLLNPQCSAPTSTEAMHTEEGSEAIELVQPLKFLSWQVSEADVKLKALQGKSSLISKSDWDAAEQVLLPNCLVQIV